MLGALRQVSYLISTREEGSKVSGSDTTTPSSPPLSSSLLLFKTKRYCCVHKCL